MRAVGGVALVFVLSATALAGQQLGRIDVPVLVGGTQLDACGSNGQIVGLDPRGDGFLSIRSGPGGKPYREIDRRYNGQQVYVCGQIGPWYAIVYAASGRLEECGVMQPWPVRQPYTGPCRYGWAHSRYVEIYAG